jgi:hypothetical protein
MDRNESDFTSLKQTKPEPELATKPRFYFNWSLAAKILGFFVLMFILGVLQPWIGGTYFSLAAAIVYIVICVCLKNPNGY